MPEIPPRIIALLPDEPQANSGGGAVRAWYFINTLSKMGELHAYTLTAGCNERNFRFPDGSSCNLYRVDVSASEQAIARSYFPTAILSLLLPWIRQGRYLILAGHNICVSRSHLPNFSRLHWFYGLLLLLVFSIARRFWKLAPWDVHIRGACLDKQMKRIAADFRDQSPDVIWTEHSYLYPVAEQLKKLFPLAKVAINAHNVEAELKRSIAQNHPTWLGRAWGEHEADNVARMERRMVREAWLVACCSSNDRERFAKQQSAQPKIQANLEVAPNGVDTIYFSKLSAPPSSNKKVVIFTGTAGYPPNDEAVRWLIQYIWPLIKSKTPDAQLWLAGRNAERQWQPLVDAADDIRLFSDVADMRPLMSQASIAIVPLRSGSGTRLKILEAFSMQLPVVSTTIGAEGLGVRDHLEILIANSNEELANAVSTLLANDSLRNRLAEAGRERAVNEFDWQRISHRFQIIFQAAWTKN